MTAFGKDKEEQAFISIHSPVRGETNVRLVNTDGTLFQPTRPRGARRYR